MLGQFNIFNSECPNKEVPLKAVLSHRGHYNIKKEIVQPGASVWSNESYLEVLGGTPQANCYVGSPLCLPPGSVSGLSPGSAGSVS